ncbi:hypothetical protein [Nannocystis punicea]|uniref:Uncharacterized protein n=1 Tax=Nannocystis punicea TaxID=2995304 RepID=A0ABY7H6H8_9BACT|nr:hypothetical protein [Nannocystis poenicansa]WAS94886.1 hypothetical protein O0S08_01885 [Nannocystis poenicansa]
MSDEPVTTPELVAAYRDRERPSDAAKERMARALMAAAAARSATVIPLRPAPRRRRTTPIGWLALAAALALVGASSYWLVGARHERATGPADLLMDPQRIDESQERVTPRPGEPVRAKATVAPVQPASPPGEAAAPAREVPAASEPPAADPAPRRPARLQSRPVAAEQPRPVTAEQPPVGGSQVDPVLEELMLIQQIKDALDADRPGDALTAIDAHARKFARGSLAEEREALRVVALCDAGEAGRGERAQAVFMRTYPRSAYRERVRAACPTAASTAEESTTD